MFFSISSRKKNEKEEKEGIRESFRPENFLPGVVIGFIIGLLVDLTKPSKNPSKSILGKNPSKSSSLSSYQDDELKMVLVVRQDLKMGPGKIASQCAHAATGMYAELVQSQRSLLRQWEQCGQPKIVVTCKNQKEMNKLQQEAENIGLPTYVVADAGRTQ
ncbi:Peptidyl-tRNA hydrolase 2 mitochondrial, partial [Bienertia sinuspersici]